MPLSDPMDDDDQDHQQPAAKRQRTLACRRCRSRKQKCEDTRPCSNCVKGGETCVATEPAPRPHVDSEYVRLLEDRIAALEPPEAHQNFDDPGIVNTRSEEHQPNGMAAVNGARRARTESSGAAMTSPMRQRPVTQRRPSVLSGTSSAYAQVTANDDQSDLDHMLFGLIASPAARSSPAMHHSSAEDVPAASPLIPNLPPELEAILLEAYRERAQAQYPFFHWDTFIRWQSEWTNCLPCDVDARSWQGFFVNMVYATSVILLRRTHAAAVDARSFYRNGVSLLPAVFKQPDRLLHIQAYLLLSVHALHESSTERIISLASTTIRQCVQQQLHLGETEPAPVDIATRLTIQVRRRCWWCAYLLDRLVMASFDLPPSIPDLTITVRTFANIEDCDLLGAATAANGELIDSPSYTCMSSALHILQCRRIQSEISAVSLRWDYSPAFEHASDWRIRILAELENYKARVQNFSDPYSKGYTSQRWQAMIYHYTLLMLYRPTKANVTNSAGDWSVQASSQACLMFRRTQIDRQIAQPWLALLVQFQSGITLLYCLWATPPEHRTENYDSLDVPDALRACSNILAIMADRWAKADCLRDVFELLAREIPLVDRPDKPPTRLTERAIFEIQQYLPDVRALVVHRPTLRMIEEMISEDFPRHTQRCQRPSVADLIDHNEISGAREEPRLPHASDMFQMPFSVPQSFGDNGIPDMQNLDVYGLLPYPGVFDLDNWT